MLHDHAPSTHSSGQRQACPLARGTAAAGRLDLWQGAGPRSSGFSPAMEPLKPHLEL